MNYVQTLRMKIDNTDGNLLADWTDDSTPFSELASTAEEYIERGSIEGKIGALFIYQQLSIEIMKVLILYCNFYQQICVYPLKIEFKKIAKDESFSHIFNEFKYKIEFKNKKKIIDSIVKLNKLRNKFGHELFSKWWEHDVEGDLKGLKEDFENIFHNYKMSLDDIRENIKMRKQHPEIIRLMKQ